MGPGSLYKHRSLNSAHEKTTNIRQGWKKPPEGKLMVNVDAAFDTGTGSGSTGVIIRDDNGCSF